MESKNRIELIKTMINKINEQESSIIAVPTVFFLGLKEVLNLQQITDYSFHNLLFTKNISIAQRYLKMKDKIIILNPMFTYNEKSMYFYDENNIETDGLIKFYTITDDELEKLY